MNDVIKLSIPKEPKYISIVRLAVSGVSMGMGFDIDSIEDLKVSLAEACINALNFSDQDQLNIEFEVGKGEIIARVYGAKDSDEPNLAMGALIINSLMDEVTYHDYGIEMIKDLQVSNNDY